MVWAICGRMPEMMQSAPISRAATTVFRMCWATWVSTAGTPVMSMIAYGEPVSTRVWSSRSITTWARAESRVPTSGTATTPSQSLTTGVESSSSCSAWSAIRLSRAADVALEGEQAHLVDQRGEGDEVAQRVGAAARPPSARAAASLSAKTLIAVSVAEKPCRARPRDSSASTARSSAALLGGQVGWRRAAPASIMRTVQLLHLAAQLGLAEPATQRTGDDLGPALRDPLGVLA